MKQLHREALTFGAFFSCLLTAINRLYMRRYTIFLFLLAFAGCKDDEPKFKVGEETGGGVIFYVDASGDHGLIAAKMDQGLVNWGCTDTEIDGAEGTERGTGEQNTIDIMNGCNDEVSAARLCFDLILNGYDDWFLPSKDEINILMHQKELVGGFQTTSGIGYWTSSELTGKDAAWVQTFSDTPGLTAFGEYNDLYVRAIRKF
jgi:hypothetical protein